MNNEVIALILAVVWILLGVSVMWYAQRSSHIQDNNQSNAVEEGQGTRITYGRGLSYYSLLLFVNAALSVYIPSLNLALTITIFLAVIGALIQFVVYKYVVR